VPSEPAFSPLRYKDHNKKKNKKQLTAGGECSVNGMEVDVIDCIYKCLIFRIWRRVSAVAFEGKVAPSHRFEYWDR
jgi:hypothetical protein